MHPFLEDVTAETAAILHVLATAQGLSVDAYLRLLLGLGSAEHTLAAMSNADFDALLDGFAKGTEHVVPLPANCSRGDIYADHA